MPPRTPRKDLQLCAQVRDALWYILGSTVGDDLLGELQVVSVEPLPDATRLLIALSTTRDSDILTATERLKCAAKAIRAEVAATIHRRKAPELVFRVVSA